MTNQRLNKQKLSNTTSTLLYIRRTTLLCIGKTAFIFCMLCLCLSLQAKNIITGTVIDETANPIIGATVKLTSSTGLKLQTATDQDGKFLLTIEEDTTTSYLSISYLGYNDYQIHLEGIQKGTDLGKIQLTPSTKEMKEVEVIGKREIDKIDRKIILPSKLQLKASTNALALLQNMQLTGIRVNTINNTVTTLSGKAVQLRINGVECKIDEVKAIRPQDIIKVEYHDMPGSRYADAPAVIDFIVRYKNDGGNINGDFTNGITMFGFGNYQLSANYHKGKSELKANGYWNRRDFPWTRENYEEYHYPTGTIKNKEIGEPTKVRFDNMKVSLWYNYTSKKSSFSAIFRDSYDHSPNSGSDRISTLYRNTDIYHITDQTHNNVNSPSLDLYFQSDLGHNQHLYLDVIGTYIGSKSNRNYTLTAIGQPDQTIISLTEGNKYSLIGEGIYEKTFSKSALTFGLKHTQSYTRNIYDGNIGSTVKMNTAQTYAYSEWRSKLGKLSYTLGIGAMRIFNQQGDNHLSKLILRPKIALAYQPTNNITIKYQGYVSGYAPSLSEISDVMQDIDTYQIRKGNPDLKAVTFVSNNLMINWGTQWFDVSWNGTYSCDYHPMMEETSWNGSKFVRTTANQKRFHRFNTQLGLRLHPFGEWFSLQITPFFNRYISNGNTYTHTHSNWGVTGDVIAMYKSWIFSAEMNTSYHNLWGETLGRGESFHAITIGYKRDRWALQLTMMNPFTKQYKSCDENFSHLAPYQAYAYSKDLCRVLTLNFSFNLDYGKQKSSATKRITNSDKESGVMHGR